MKSKLIAKVVFEILSISDETEKKAIRETLSDIILEIDSGAFDTVTINCECGQQEHSADAAYCGKCGKKLERTATNNSL